MTARGLNVAITVLTLAMMVVLVAVADDGFIRALAGGVIVLSLVHLWIEWQRRATSGGN